MIPTSDLVKGSFRLLEVDNRVVLPVNTHVRVLVTAADVGFVDVSKSFLFWETKSTCT
jgi:hypothetical protein